MPKKSSAAYCQLESLGEQLSQRADELEIQLGPEYRPLFDALNDADPLQRCSGHLVNVRRPRLDLFALAGGKRRKLGADSRLPSGCLFLTHFRHAGGIFAAIG